MEQIVNKTVYLNCCISTIPVMDWIWENGAPLMTHVWFKNQKSKDCMIVSSVEASDISSLLELNPVETWFSYFGMKRLAVCDSTNDIDFYFYIKDRLYHATPF
jgi:hypothetical protein